MPLYADIVLPLYQPTYTFEVEEGCDVAAGDAVAVQFGARAVYTGIVWRIHSNRPNAKRIKSISQKLYDQPLLSARQMEFWEWIADYYMCTLGEVMRVALPAMIKPRAADEESFEREQFRPRMVAFVVPCGAISAEEREKLERRAPRQSELLALLEQRGEVRRAECDAAAVAALRRKGLVEIVEREIIGGACAESDYSLPQLTERQQEACDQILHDFEQVQTVLLRGVTGSGKTEIYMHLIANVLAKGGNVLYLLPEIAMTSQLLARVKRVFGERVTPYHSKLTSLRRAEIYQRLNRSEGGEVVVGTRSALFLPLHNIELIIVDEEHDSSYKQMEPAPRYQGRDAAVMLAHLHGAKCLLGSATPSIESYVRAATGKYREVVLAERYGGAQLPDVIVSDTIRAVKRGERKSHFNKILLDKIGERLERGEQVLLFQNRRGVSPYVSCGGCGWTAQCPHCNVSLTLHGGNRLTCHYCGYTEPLPRVCPDCNQADVVPKGFGTEKVEQEILALFPEARVARLDRDTLTSESACNRIVEAFERGDTDILVGTQIITKGFDFSKVTLVGVLNADNLLNAPDYRASERAFQTIMQFAGRGGRGEKRGEVVIQTSEPEHPILQQVVRGDYVAMACEQSAERQAYLYPPYARLVGITMRYGDVEVLHRAAVALAEALRGRFAQRVLGPTMPLVDRVRGEHIVEIMLKVESGASFARARKILRETMDAILSRQEYRKIVAICNVDAS